MKTHLTQDILYIGTDDCQLDLFENQYITPEGMAYNSYLIKDEKTAIMDTSDPRTAREWMEHLEEALEERQPDYLIVHHMEPDHSSLIADILQKYPDLKIVASKAGVRMITQFFEDIPLENRTIEVKDNEELQLGKHCLRFFMTPMIHWPEVMMSYDSKDHILFSADAFGKFGALSQTGGLFCTPETDWACEARRYYFNICGKYGVSVQNAMKKIKTNADVHTICPLHGPVIQETLATQWNLYDIWSQYKVETPGIFIAYASIHGNTRKAALALAEMLEEKGCPKVAISDLCRSDMAENIEDAFRYGTIVLAASSYDNVVFPPMHDFLWHLQIKGWQKRKVAIIENGSWAPSAGKTMKEMLQHMKNITLIEPIITLTSSLKQADRTLLDSLAQHLMEDCSDNR